ncbi:hypothetical protein [Nocardia sp. NPDC052316]|uniref:hypothetical protein n=1 Tax=Nocardia sp. NPDC052316 TaxID=3364329 RepID=UPI0037CB7A53
MNCSVEPAVELSELEERAAAEVEFSRTEVYIAAGMVAVQLAVPSDEGLDRLRACAYAQRRSRTAVAADIVARRLPLRGNRNRIEGAQRRTLRWSYSMTAAAPMRLPALISCTPFIAVLQKICVWECRLSSRCYKERVRSTPGGARRKGVRNKLVGGVQRWPTMI